MRLANKIILLLLPAWLFAQQPDVEIQKALEQFILLFEKASEAAKDLSQTDQQVIPEEKSTFTLYYKRVENRASVEKRSDALIKAQISYKFFTDKEIPASTIMIIVRNGSVELYGKTLSKEAAQKAIDQALKVRGVKEVTSYLIVKEPAKISL
ncbi:MAG: hypothetical protein C6H99_06930 [Epsilonproteobacteria bacterium]|nr:hypothetical protein [Campylobacterota bacterium]NPA65024.1 BON domain-containing protein [Campylobacterota bacterium]